MRDGPFKKILVAVDGSLHANRAAQLAAQLAAGTGASLLLLHARPHVGEYLGEPYYQQLLDRVCREAENLLAAVRADLGETDQPPEDRILEGDPAVAIITAAETESCDLIVMGSRGRSDAAGLLLGSVSHKVLSGAPCPVLLVR